MNKIVKWGLGLFAAWYVVTNPKDASSAARAGIDALESVGQSVATFMGTFF